MTPELEPPNARPQPTPNESTTDAKPVPTEIFPYDPADDATPLPVPTSRGVLSAEDGPTGRPGETSCPACSGETINGAGLFTCTDCPWHGTLR